MGIHENLGGPLARMLGVNKKNEKEIIENRETNLEEYLMGEQGEARETLKKAAKIAMKVSKEWNKLPPNDNESGAERIVLLSTFSSLKGVEDSAVSSESPVKTYFDNKWKQYKKEAGENETKKVNLYKLLYNEMNVIYKDLQKVV